MKASALICFLTCALTALCACGTFDREAVQKMRYLLEVERTPALQAAGGAELEVRPFHVATPFAASSFVYRNRGGSYAADFYNEFFVPPAVMLANITRTWLGHCGLFAAVHAGASRRAATHVLEVDVQELFGDFEQRPAEAVLSMHVVLLSAEDESLILQKDYLVRQPLQGDEPAQLVAGWAGALEQLLTSLESDLRGALEHP